jgi:DNA-binding transcriptional LysR family regulator
VNVIGDLNLLVALRALLEERSVTGAGVRIGMGQPAMSGALARLRRHFDDELLLRVGRRYELTPLAQQLLPLVQDTVELAERTLEVRTGFRPESSRRTFTLTVSDYALATVVDLLVTSIRGRGCEVHLDVELLPPSSDAGVVRVLQLRRDVLVLPLGHVTHGRTQRLYSDDIVCVADKDNPKLDGDKVSLDMLAVLPHATAQAEQSLLGPAYRRLTELGIEWNSVLRIASAITLPQVVVGTDLIALVPRRVAEMFSCGGRTLIAALPFEADLTEVMHWHPSRDDDPGHRWLRSMVRRAALEIKDGATATGRDLPVPSALPPSDAGMPHYERCRCGSGRSAGGVSALRRREPDAGS